MNVALATPTTDIRLRSATVADKDAVAELVSLVDLHQPADKVSAVLDGMQQALQATEGEALSHSRVSFLIAEGPDGQQVGLAVCGLAKWMTEAPRVLRHQLIRRFATVQVLAVRPDSRQQGIARALLQQTEQSFREAGYQALTLRHGRELTSFYQKVGYTSAARLSLLLPAETRLTLADRGWRQAFKILSPSVSTIERQGHPAIIDHFSD
ncbi:GNAT family N-acetyltransferase [Streptomyces sp. NRRL S-350]|uniref:GNAT family N-acetyltransferase n=1 Tax=Streptomyces sp. NRRL S-350 TaxID=1463902 RepID=UPI0004C06959|nr:GNAT family N-acetyltransferase [Streptomyces sp. NRRL S-350]